MRWIYARALHENSANLVRSGIGLSQFLQLIFQFVRLDKVANVVCRVLLRIKDFALDQCQIRQSNGLECEPDRLQFTTHFFDGLVAHQILQTLLIGQIDLVADHEQ